MIRALVDFALKSRWLVLGGVVVAKMAQAVKTDARSHAAADLRLGFRVMTLADAKHQIGVAEFE